jgi:hypothetical protein
VTWVDIRNVYRILVVKPLENIHLECQGGVMITLKWITDTCMVLCGYEVDGIGSRLSPVTDIGVKQCQAIKFYCPTSLYIYIFFFSQDGSDLDLRFWFLLQAVIYLCNLIYLQCMNNHNIGRYFNVFHCLFFALRNRMFWKVVLLLPSDKV